MALFSPDNAQVGEISRVKVERMQIFCENIESVSYTHLTLPTKA